MDDESAAQRPPGDEHLWEVGFDGHQRAQQARMAKWTLKQKIEWLEQAHYMVLHLQAQREARGEQTSGADAEQPHSVNACHSEGASGD